MHVKSPKIDRVGAGDTIEIFQTDNFMCPYKAFEKYRKVSSVKEKKDSPVFRTNTKKCLTGKEIMKSCLH